MSIIVGRILQILKKQAKNITICEIAQVLQFVH